MGAVTITLDPVVLRALRLKLAALDDEAKAEVRAHVAEVVAQFRHRRVPVERSTWPHGY